VIAVKVNKNYLEIGRDVDSFRYSSGSSGLSEIASYGYKKLFEGIGKGLDYVFDRVGINQFIEYVNPGYAYAVDSKPSEWEYNSRLLKKALGSV
jgi:hypothetical protein